MERIAIKVNDSGLVEGKIVVESFIPDGYQLEDDEYVAMLAHDGADIGQVRRQAKEHRAKDMRDAQLAECDWVVLDDSPVTNEVKQNFRVYRQALRDLPQHQNWPDVPDSDWPMPPALV